MSNKKTEAQIINCNACRNCFKSQRSRTGYACEVWGYDDFAEDTVLSGYCHKAKPLYQYQAKTETWRGLE